MTSSIVTQLTSSNYFNHRHHHDSYHHYGHSLLQNCQR